MNLREVREAAERIDASNVKDVDIVCQHIFATIDPSTDEPITAEWLREEWGFHEDDGMMLKDKICVAKCPSDGGGEISVWLQSYNRELSDMRRITRITTRQQFCDLARCLGIPRRKDGK